MTKIPKPVNTIASLIDEYHESKQSPPRPHFGLSMCGHKCERWLWLSFRWAVIEKFSGRILRLFSRGHAEEYTMVANLKAVGMEITNTGFDDQFKVDAGCNVQGSLDGIIHSGVPGAEKTKHILEGKTHSKKSFDELEKKGVKEAKPLHYAQMQAYMLLSEIDRALYYAICKDDDRIYIERVKLDKEFAEKKVERSKRIAMTERLPPPISTDPTWWECRFCAAHSFCHKERITKEINCRTCAHATPLVGNGFRCDRWESDIPVEVQRVGCRSHVVHPDLLPENISLDGEVDRWTAKYRDGGTVYDNGEKGMNSKDFLEVIV